MRNYSVFVRFNGHRVPANIFNVRQILANSLSAYGRSNFDLLWENHSLWELTPTKIHHIAVSSLTYTRWVDNKAYISMYEILRALGVDDVYLSLCGGLYNFLVYDK